MDRREYLLLCRQCAMLEKNEKNVPYDCPDELRVVWNGMEFYPMSLTISFDRHGNVVNRCQFHDLHANSVAGANLWEVEMKWRQDDGSGENEG